MNLSTPRQKTDRKQLANQVSPTKWKSEYYDQYTPELIHDGFTKLERMVPDVEKQVIFTTSHSTGLKKSKPVKQNVCP